MSTHCCYLLLLYALFLSSHFQTKVLFGFSKEIFSKKLSPNKAYKKFKKKKDEKNKKKDKKKSISNSSILASSNLVIYHCSCFSKGPLNRCTTEKLSIKFRKTPNKATKTEYTFCQHKFHSTTDDFLEILERKVFRATISLKNSEHVSCFYCWRKTCWVQSVPIGFFLVRIFPCIDCLQWFTIPPIYGIIQTAKNPFRHH